ncbi:MAG: hypothetical protein WCG91_01280 [Candidatus Shapirobacteria bacterium]
MQIIPTILEKQFDLAEEKIKLIKDEIRWIQIDVIDNVYLPGKTFELERLTRSQLNTENILWETHLMVNEPIKWIEKSNFIDAARIIGQVEMMSDLEEFVSKVKDTAEAGLAFDIETEIKEIPEETDLVLLMARKAGFESQEFDDRIFEKIEKLKIMREERDLRFKIGVDGGINENNIEKLKEAGVDVAYCGGAIFNGNVLNNLENLKSHV